MMQLITCKTCGGSVVKQGNYYVCESCGNKWIGDLSNDVHAVERVNAWQALRECDFEKASELFEAIIVKDNTNHEAYWGRALALNGIIYVNDVRENKKVPTCNNITEGSFLADKDVKKAIDLAPDEIKASYKNQADYIEKIRIEWIEKASKEPPYDVFISFKDSDRENGIDRTQDSYDAQELYTSLVDLGYKVFFSRVSLRDKVSEHYEPYIYNAIKTAKVMIVFGEKPEYFSSTWIKNEWSRFRARIEKGEKHKNALVVVTKNMNASDLPVALKSRQALNMSDITFFETLKKHIKRVIDESKQGVRLDKIEIKGGQISKKVTSLEVNTIQTREIGAGATAKTDITEKQTLKLVETYMNMGQWDDAEKLVDDVLFRNGSSAGARWKQLLIKNRVTNITDFASKIVKMNVNELKIIDQILSQANQEMATGILDLLYSSYNGGISDWQYCEILKIILPYQYKNREQKIKYAFGFAIVSSAKKTFELLLSTIESDDVDVYIDLNLQYANKAKNSADKIECLNRILKVDEGNIDALRLLLYAQLENNENSKIVLKTFETLLKYSNNSKSEISNILYWLALNINSADDCLLARQVLRYSSEDIAVYKKELIDLSESMISRSFFEDAEYFSKLILSFDAENTTAYWNICLIKTHSTKEANIVQSDILLGSLPEFNKYLTLVSEARQSICIKLKIEQEKTIKQREEARVAEIRRQQIEAERKRKLIEEKQRQARIERETKAIAKRKANISMISIILPYIMLISGIVLLLVNDFDESKALIILLPIVYSIVCIIINYRLEEGLVFFEDVYAPIIKYAWSKNGVWLWLIFLAPILLAILGGSVFLFENACGLSDDDRWQWKLLWAAFFLPLILGLYIILPLYILFAPVITGYLVYCRKVG